MKLVFATNNPNKLSEIRSLVPEGIEILSLREINCNEELPETNPTLQENAFQKAKYVFDNYGFNCFADDTGLEIDALGGEPGVYSARYAGDDCLAEDNIKRVLHNLQGVNDRSAQFRTVIALIVDGKEGKVVDINLRYVTLKTQGSTILVPNSLSVSKTVVVNT